MPLNVQVWLSPEAEHLSRAGRFQVLEVDNVDDFNAFCARVAADSLIVCNQLHTRRIDDDRAEITRRIPIALRGSAITRCQVNPIICVETA